MQRPGDRLFQGLYFHKFVNVWYKNLDSHLIENKPLILALCWAGLQSSFLCGLYKWFEDNKSQFQIFMRVIEKQQEQQVSIIPNHSPYMIISKINIAFYY